MPAIVGEDLTGLGGYAQARHEVEGGVQPDTNGIHVLMVAGQIEGH